MWQTNWSQIKIFHEVENKNEGFQIAVFDFFFFI